MASDESPGRGGPHRDRSATATRREPATATRREPATATRREPATATRREPATATRREPDDLPDADAASTTRHDDPSPSPLAGVESTNGRSYGPVDRHRNGDGADRHRNGDGADRHRNGDQADRRRNGDGSDRRWADGPAGNRPAGPDDGSARKRPVGPDDGPDSPTQLSGTGWRDTLRRTGREFSEDSLTDWAAALTYYGVLSIFPGLLVLISLLGLLGESATNEIRDTVADAVPEQNVQRIIEGAIDQASASGGLASVAAVLGLLAAFWSASGYVAAFMRASNAIYDVPEGRPIWKTLPIRVGVTAVIGVMLLASAVIVVFTGRLAEAAGDAIGLGSTAVTVWNIAKWPVLLVLVSLMFALLYWASPNARHGGFRWVSPGGVLAVVLWLVISGLFALYVSNFGSYNKTYGALAGVIVFLIWLWLTNIAILLGAEFDAELERSRAIAAGHSPEEEPYVELRDDRKLRKKARKRDREQGREPHTR